jgi:hypothetical protein
MFKEDLFTNLYLTLFKNLSTDDSDNSEKEFVNKLLKVKSKDISKKLRA